jgi:hypothetical protein
MSKGQKAITVAAILAAMAAGTPLVASDRADHNSEPYYRTQNLIDLHVRYPGDSSYSFGTYRHRGPEQGPYVERCTWTANDTFFGLPLGITQHCVRYTNENTN